MVNGNRLTAFICCLVIAACDQGPSSYKLAMSTEEPAPTIARALQHSLANAEFSIEIVPYADSAEILPSLVAGEIDFAIVEEPHRVVDGVSVLTPLYPSILHVLHNRGDHVGDFRELLLGASIYPGPNGSSAHQLLMLLAPDLGLSNEDFRILDNPWQETPDVFFIFGGLLPPESRSQLADYRLFNFAAPNDVPGGTVADAIALRHHNVRLFLIPRATYFELAENATLTLATRSVLATGDDFDAQAAYAITSHLHNNAQQIAEHYPLATHELNDAVRAGELMIPLHEGSRRYLDRDEPGFVERYVDVLALYLTIALTVLSGLVALLRHRSQIKKDRLDDFFAKLIKIRTNVSSGNSEQSADFRRQVTTLQHEVTNLLIDERIDADANLTAFFELSNQLINELDA